MSRDVPVKHGLNGNLDMDSDPRNVREGNYMSAMDIIKQDDAGGVSGTVQPTQRNKHAFSLGSVEAQNKKYQITLSGDAAATYEVRFMSTRRDVNMIPGAGANGAVQFNGTVASFQAAFATAVAAGGQVGGWQQVVSGNKITITCNVYDYYQWWLESTGSEDIEVVCTQEAIPTDLAGPLKDIGSYDLLGELFVYSTSQDNLPEEASYGIVGVGPIGTGQNAGLLVGPLTILTLSATHNLIEGQWIRITDSNATWLNGLFLVAEIVSPTQVRIVTDTSWGAVHPPVQLGEERIILNPTGLGAIGVGRKEISTGAWTYIRLISSTELNFVSRYRVDAFGVLRARSSAHYYTDNLNLPRVFYYYGDYIHMGALNHVTPYNIYNFDNIANESALQLETSPAVLRFEGQDRNGGNLTPGAKYYAIRQFTEAFTASLPSNLEGPVIVFKPNPITSPTGFITYGYEVAGYATETPTTVRNLLSVQGLDGLSYTTAEIICVESVGGVLVANSVHTFNIPATGRYQYYHTGFEVTTLVDVAELFTSAARSSAGIIRAKNIRSVDSRAVLSNMTTIDDLDLHKWARSIRHELFMDPIKEATLSVVGEMQDPSIVYDNLGLMLNEVVRLSIRVFLRGIGWTSWYWVDDIKVDTNPINTANPDGENRRVGTFSSYELATGEYSPLTSPEISSQGFLRTGPVWDQNNAQTANYFLGTQIGEDDIAPMIIPGVVPTEGWFPYFKNAPDQYGQSATYNVPKVKLHIDWNYYSADVIAQDLYKMVTAVEFGMGDIPKSISASGLGVLGVSSSKKFIANFQDDWDDAINNDKVFEFPFCPFRTFNTPSPYNHPSTGDPIYSPLVPNYPIINYGGAGIYIPQVNEHPILATERRDFISFYSPDHLIDCTVEDPGGGNAILAEADKIVVLGDYMTYKLLNGGAANTFSQILPGNFTRGDFSVLHPQGADYQTLQEIDIVTNGLAFIKDNNPVGQFPGGDIFERKDSIFFWEDQPNPVPWPDYAKLNTRFDLPVFKLAAPVGTSNEFINDRRKQSRGLVYCQVFSDRSAVLPTLNGTLYTKIGHTVFFPNRPDDVIAVNGGDTLTSLFHFKQRSFSYQDGQVGTDLGLFNSSMLGMVCQSRKNIKALNPYEADFPSKLLYPPSYYGNTDPLIGQTEAVTLGAERKALGYWTFPASSGQLLPPLATGWWNGHNNILSIIPDYDYSRVSALGRSLPSQENPEGSSRRNSHPNRVAWSDASIESAVRDFYRIIMPLAFKDLDLSYGEIAHHEDVGGELFTAQDRKFQLQFFNSRGVLQGNSEGVEVLLGATDVMSRDGRSLSGYGAYHKDGFIKGTSPAGKDVLYWFHQESGLFMRFGADGTSVISDHHHLRAFSANNTRWTEGQDIPAHSYGIRSVWDDRFKEAIWTFIGIRDVAKYIQPGIFTPIALEGAVVHNPNAPSDTFENLPRLFIATDSHSSFPQNEPGVGVDWEEHWRQIDYDDIEYYSVFTLAYNELTKGFSTKYNHIPKTYLRWKNKFLSSHPIHRSEIFEHRVGHEDWYTFEGVGKPSQAYIEPVINALPEATKKFIAVQALSTTAPDRVEFKTENHESFLEAAEYERNDDGWRSPIKQDSTITGDPTTGEESLFGSYIRAKLIWNNGSTNRIHNFIVKVRERLRRYTV